MKCRNQGSGDLKTSSIPIPGGKPRSVLPKIVLKDMVYLVLENLRKKL